MPLLLLPPSLASRDGLNLFNAQLSPKRVRVQELCEGRGGRPGLPVPNKPTVFVDVKPHFNRTSRRGSEFRSCVKVEVTVLGSPSLISLRFLWT